MKNQVRTSYLLTLLVVVFVSFLLISNILANQMLKFFIFTIDAATLTFPITYILSDVFSEVYGYKWSRRVSWIGMSMSLIFSLFIMLAIRLPHPEWFDASHFQLAIGGSFRIVIASAVAYLFGDLVNDKIFKFMKAKRVGMKGFSIRAIVSSFGGSIVDTTLFVLIAFLFIVPVPEMWGMIFVSVFLKTGYEIIILPVTTLVTKWVKNKEGDWNE
jgi:hypothetical protein